MENYDFYSMGARYANEETGKLKQMMKNIKNEYGEEARIDFEAGVISALDHFKEEFKLPQGMEIPVQTASEEVAQGTKDIGKPNTRNSSYTTDSGRVGVQYIERNGQKIFNEPKVNEDSSNAR